MHLPTPVGPFDSIDKEQLALTIFGAMLVVTVWACFWANI